jgi:hypothetical protein
VKLRIRKNIRGTFLNIRPDTNCVSVYRGDVVDCPEPLAQQLLLNGTAETKLDGPLGRDGEIPPPRELTRLRAEVAALTAPHPVDELRALRKSGRREAPEYRELLHRVINL